jgi:hypothetical protein
LSPGIVLVALSVLVTAVLSALRLRRVLFRENVDGRALLSGLEPRLAAGDAGAVLAACEELSGTAVAEVIKAAVEAAPEGREAVERAVDEAQLDWLPEREAARGLLGTLARLCGAVGMLGGAIEIRTALAREAAVLPLGPIVLTLGGGILGVVIALFARALVSRTIERIRDETARAARRLPDLLSPGEKALELSSAQNDSM